MDSRFLQKIKRRDRFARWAIVTGGVSIIASMMVMIVFMVKVTLPLFQEPSRELLRRVEIPELTEPLIFDLDPYLELGLGLDESGTLTIFELHENGKIVQTQSISPEPEAPAEPAETVEPVALVRAEKYGKHHYNLFWSDGSASQLENEFKVSFDEQDQRQLESHAEVLVHVGPFDVGEPTAMAQLQRNEEGTTTYVRLIGDRELFVYRMSRSEDFFGEVTEEESRHRFEIEGSAPIAAMALRGDGKRLYIGTRAGTLLLYNLDDITTPEMMDTVQATDQGVGISTMNFPFGQASIAVGDERGIINIWSLIRYEEGARLRKIHRLQGHNTAVSIIRPSTRDKSLVSRGTNGELLLTHLTSERRLIQLEPELDIQGFALAERMDGLLLRDAKNVFWLWGLDIPHPEISWKTLWGKVWYEGYQEKEFAWQSSSASDDFEPKLSLVPLLFGSLKGTFYGMMFSLPLALLCAMYVSHLMEPRWRVVVKPVVELMAAVPTVVIGFLAALWLAPKLEANLLAVLFAMIVIPLFVFIAMWILIKRKRKVGAEFLFVIPLVILGYYVAYQVGLLVQETAFGGNLNLWLFQSLGMDVDQRNCVVISFALGFAVIPIIFTISEDALYNVPKHLTAAALALGSSRWQTLRRVVLPMASPGIFAATMIGFGRAVGETMIVLMATGNTPIMSPNILNGMRTLSANIAVEIPEAPVGSTLFRLLFLSAVLLFCLTFIVNTLAEIVRQRLQKKYKNL